MKKFNGNINCDCGYQFEWNCSFLDKDSYAVVGILNNITSNCKNVTETEFQYIIQLQCPHCLKRHFATIDK